MFDKKDIIEGAKLLGIEFDKFTIDDLVTGTNIELEHGTKNPITNITNDDLLMTMKIALAHLNEFPNYYNKEDGLPHLEETLTNKRFIYFH